MDTSFGVDGLVWSDVDMIISTTMEFQNGEVSTSLSPSLNLAFLLRNRTDFSS